MEKPRDLSAKIGELCVHWAFFDQKIDRLSETAQQTFEIATSGPIYVSVEPWPECFELEPVIS